MKKSISRIIGVIMLIVAIVFIMFALNHPEKSFPWNNTIKMCIRDSLTVVMMTVRCSLIRAIRSTTTMSTTD